MNKNKLKNRGILSKVIYVIAISMSLFHIYTSCFGILFSIYQRGIHLTFALVLIFLIYNGKKGSKDGGSVSIFSVVFIIMSIASTCYLMFSYNSMIYRFGIPTKLDLIFATMLILVVLEATRRAVGKTLTIVAIIFILYACLGPYLPGFLNHRPFTVSRIFMYLYQTPTGIFGLPLGVSAQFVFMFILFGAVMRKVGMGQFILDLSTSLTGHQPGGPAKIAVISSCIMGMISGSSTANVVTTGSFTIPLMKKIGYPSHFAGAVEAVASTGGQFMPPIMGAAAFIMAEFLGITYIKIAFAALIPGFLYYAAIFISVHLRAKKIGLEGVPKNQLPNLWTVLKAKGIFILPLLIIMYILIRGFSPIRAAFMGFASVVIIGILMRNTSFKDFLDAFEEGARDAIGIAMACATCGIIMGIVTLTGIGLKVSNIMLTMVRGDLLALLFLTMITSIILGMGLPTTAKYVVLVTMAVPAAVKLGVTPMAAHLFVLYFGVLADITPPVALASYAAAGISGSDPVLVGFTALRLGVAGFILPFIFCYNNSLLAIGSFWQVVYTTVLSLISVICLSSGFEGFFIIKSKIYESIFLIAASIMIFLGLASYSAIYFLIAPFLILFVVFVLQKKRVKKEKTALLNGDRV